MAVICSVTAAWIKQLEGTPLVITVIGRDGRLAEISGDEAVTELLLHQPDQGSPLTVSYSAPFQHSYNTEILGTITITTLATHANPLLGTIAAAIVDSVERELRLQKFSQQWSLVNEMMNTVRSGMVVTDMKGTIVEFNSVAEQLMGWTKEDLTGRPISDLRPLSFYVEEAVNQGTGCEDVLVEIHNDQTQTTRACLLDVQPILDEYSRPIGILSQLKDITALHHKLEDYQYMAYHDELTCLPNQRHLEKHIHQWLETTKENKQLLAILYMDMDRFKQVNDTFGHYKGSSLLRTVAKELKACLPDQTINRVGGDEFVICLPVERHSEAVAAARKILGRFEQDFVVDNEPFRVSVSIGISFYPHDGLDAKTLINHADQAMYRAKSSGRNRYKLYSSPMKGWSRASVPSVAKLRLNTDSHTGIRISCFNPGSIKRSGLNRRLYFNKRMLYR
ncbi:hypothetical protein J2TS4_33840 [Paenibacillus sp. J2TS4]|nr:hypothetical protein J2TS4_33840 [Paenibacillus sp. J2TS4]